MLRMKTRTKGGKKLKAAIRAARNAHKGGVHSVQAGFFSGSGNVNEQGQALTNIAANNEFGARRDDGVKIPERPFMRKANASMGKAVLEVVRDGIDPLTGQIDGATAARVGATMVNHIQSSILSTNDPENAPITTARKGGGKLPLVDSGAMYEAVSYEIIDA